MKVIVVVLCCLVAVSVAKPRHTNYNHQKLSDVMKEKIIQITKSTAVRDPNVLSEVKDIFNLVSRFVNKVDSGFVNALNDLHKNVENDREKQVDSELAMCIDGRIPKFDSVHELFASRAKTILTNTETDVGVLVGLVQSQLDQINVDTQLYTALRVVLESKPQWGGHQLRIDLFHKLSSENNLKHDQVVYGESILKKVRDIQNQILDLSDKVNDSLLRFSEDNSNNLVGLFDEISQCYEIFYPQWKE